MGWKYFSIFKDFIKIIKSYSDESDDRHFFKVSVQYPEKLHDLDNDLLFLPEKNENWKNFKKLVTNLHNKTEYAIHIRNVKQALNHGLALKKGA